MTISRLPVRRSSVALARSQMSRHLSRRLPYYLTPKEVHLLIDACQNDRDRLFCRLLWETGLRVSEAIRLRLEAVGREGIRVLGKGATERVVFVQDILVAAILFYAQDYGIERSDYLFPSRKGGHITKQRADQITKEAACLAGLQRSVHAHLFRSWLCHQFPELWRASGCATGTARSQRHQHYPHLSAALGSRHQARGR